MFIWVVPAAIPWYFVKTLNQRGACPACPAQQPEAKPLCLILGPRPLAPQPTISRPAPALLLEQDGSSKPGKQLRVMVGTQQCSICCWNLAVVPVAVLSHIVYFWGPVSLSGRWHINSSPQGSCRDSRGNLCNDLGKKCLKGKIWVSL